MKSVLGLLAFSALVTAHAASLTWDADPATTGAQDGAGTWSAAGTNWWNGAANTNWNSATPDIAFFGATNGAAGTVTVSGTQAVGGVTFNAPGSGAYTLSGGVLALPAAATFALNTNATIATPMRGAGGLTKTGPGTLTLSGGNTYTGGTEVSGGVLALSYGVAPNGTIKGNLIIGAGAEVRQIFAGWTLGYDSGTNYVTNIVINGGTLNFAAGTSGTNARRITMGGGSIIGNKVDWYQTANGTKELNTLASAVSSTITGGFNLRIGSAGTLTITVEDGAADDDLLISGALTATQPSQSVAKVGPGRLTLTGTNTYNGTTTVGEGTLLIGGSGTLGGGAYAQAVAVNGSLVYGSSSTQTFSGALGGTGALVQAGSGKLSLLGANTFSGPVAVSSGTLRVNGSLAGSLAVDAAGTLGFELAGATPGAGYDRATVAGAATLAGTVTVAAVAGFKPEGLTFNILNAGAIAGGFATTNLPALDPGYAWDVQVSATSIVLSAVATDPTNLVWSPTVSAGWDTATTNWFDPGAAAPAVFQSGDRTLFDDSGAVSNVVTLTTVLTPLGVAVNSSSNYTFAGPGSLAGGMGLVKDGAGTLTITVTNNDYAGGTVISNGTVQLGAGGALGTLGVGPVANEGTLALNNTDSRAISNAVSGGGVLTKSGTGTVFLAGNNTYVGETRIAQGVLTIAAPGALGGGAYAGAITNDAALVFSGTTQTLSGVLSGTGTLTQTGSGALTLSGAVANTQSGRTVLDNGTLQFGKAGGAVAVAPGAVMQMGAGNANQPNLRMTAGHQFGEGVLMVFSNASGNWTRFDLQGSTQTLAGISTLASSGGVIQNERLGGGGTAGPATLIVSNNANHFFSGVLRDRDGGAGTWLLSLTKAGSGTQTLAGANVTYTGATVVEAGRLTLTNATAFASAISNGAVVEFAVPAAATYGRALTGAGLWFKTGTGTQHFNGGSASPIAPSGQIYLQQGVLQNNNNAVNWSNNLAAIDISAGAALDLYADPILVPALTGLGTVRSRYGNATAYSGLSPNTERLTVGLANGSGTFDGTIIDTGIPSAGPGGGLLELFKVGSGTQTLNGANTYYGVTIISGGVLALGASATISNSASIVVEPGAVLDVTAGGIRLNTNQLLRGGGLVQGAVTAQGGSRLAPGTAGAGGSTETLFIAGNVGLHAESTNYFNLAGVTNAGGGFNDLVAVTGDLEPSNSVVQVDINQSLANGTYRLFTYTGAKATSFNPAPVIIGALGRKGLYVDETTANQVNLVVTGAYANLVWLPQTNALWNGVDANWSNTLTQALDTYTNLDAVTFNEAGAYSNGVILPAVLTPGPVLVDGSSNYVFSGAGGIGGVISVTKSGAGTLTLLNTNPYTGGTDIRQGLLQVGNGAINGSFGAGSYAISNGATLRVYPAAVGATTRPAWTNISGDGTLALNTAGSGTGSADWSQLALTNTFRGALQVERGRVFALTPGALGAGATVGIATGAQLGVWNGGTFTQSLTIAGTGYGEAGFQAAIRLANAGFVTTLAGPLSLAGTATIGAAGTGLVSGVISGTGPLVLGASSLPGTVIVTATNTYTGGTTINYGTLYIQEPANLSEGTSVVTFGAAGTLRNTNSFVLTNAVSILTSGTMNVDAGSVLTVTNVISGAGTLNKAGPGTLNLLGDSTYAGNTLLYAGVLNVSGAVSHAAAVFAPGYVAGGSIANIRGRVTTLQLYTGVGNGNGGLYLLPGGLINITSADSELAFTMGVNAGGYGFFKNTGGNLNTTRFQFGLQANQGAGAVGIGIGLMTAGTVTNTAYMILARYGNSAAVGQFTLAGGTLDRSNVPNALHPLGMGWQGSGRAELNVLGGLLDNSGVGGTVNYGAGTWTGAGIFNLNGGTLRTRSILRTSGTAYFNFNGGTLQSVLNATTNLSAGLTGVYVNGPFGAFAGGAVVDTAGLETTIAADLLAPPGSGVTGIPVTAGGSGYVGAPYVSISAGGGAGAAAIANMVDDGTGNGTYAVDSITIMNPGINYSGAPTVALSGGGGSGATLGSATVAANSGGGLTKLGGGVLRLVGANTYGGATAIQAGTLLLNGMHNGGAVNVQAGAVLGGTGTVQAAVNVAAAARLQPGEVTIGGALTVSSVTFAANAVFNPLVNGTGSVLRVTATNGLTLPSGGSVATANVLNASLAIGTYTLLDYEGAIQGGAATNLVLGAFSPHAAMYLTNNAANTSIDLVVVAATEPIKWVGNIDGNWNIGAPTNWVTTIGGVPTAYLQAGGVGDALVFDDTAAGNFGITLLAHVAPSALVASNAANDYAIGGAFGITSPAPLRKYDAAKLTLTTSNNFAGGAAIYGGTLQLGDGTNAGTIGTGPVTNDGVLVISHAQTNVLANPLSGVGSLAKAGPGRVTLSVVPATNISGTVVDGGTFALVNANASKGTLTINDGGTVDATVTDAIDFYSVITVNRGGRLLHSGGSYNQFYNAGAGGTILVMNGGLLEATAPPHANYGNYLLRGNMLVGGTNVSVVAADFRMGDNATRTITVGETGEDIDLWFQGYVTHFHGASCGGFDKAGPGTMALSCPSNNVCSATISAGRLLLLDANLGVSPVNNGTLEFYTSAGSNQTFTAAISGSGTTVKSGAGALSLTGAISAAQNVVVNGGTLVYPNAQTYPGVTTVSNGLLRVQGSVVGPVTVETNGTLGGTGVVRGAVLQNGAISPGPGLGTLTVSNTLTCVGTATTRFELGGTNAPTDYDQLIVSDVHTPAGLLEVVTTNGYVPASGDAFLIISNSALGGALFGTFNTESLPALASGLGWVVQYNGTESVGLLVTGTVASATAYELWAQSITNPALRGEQEDPDGDGYANLFEYSQGSDATNAADNAKLHLARTNGQFLAAFNRVNTATDIVYEVEGAYAPTNGATWLGIATNAIGSWGSSTNVNDNNTATIHRVWVTDLELGTNRTLRLKITRP